jgi:uncharacterized protein
MLKMKVACERCSTRLGLTDEAFICSYECTFCPQCSGELGSVCPNCQGGLVLRPTRRTSPTEVARSGFKAKLQTILP